jgi:hypothetical protein
MLRCLLLLLPLAVATSLKAVPYGETKSAQTLFPPPTSSKINDIQHIDIHHRITTGNGAADSLSVLAGSGLAEAVDARDRLNMVDEANVEEEDREFDDMFEEDEDEDEDGDDLEKRQARTTPMYGGVMQIDCLLAPDICKNAGYYQNCIRQAYGNPSLVTYTNGPYDDTVTRINRIRSGVTLQGATNHATAGHGHRDFGTPKMPVLKIHHCRLMSGQWQLSGILLSCSRHRTHKSL